MVFGVLRVGLIKLTWEVAVPTTLVPKIGPSGMSKIGPSGVSKGC